MEKPYLEKKIDPKIKGLVLIVVWLIIGLTLGAIVSKISIEKARETQKPRIFAIRYTIVTMIIIVNISFLIGLLYVYADTYRKTKSSFMVGLLLFIFVLLIQSILSQLGVYAFFVYTKFGFGLFAILPHFFETIALIILLYLSLK